MKALLLAATSSLALSGFAMAQTAIETGTPGGAATPPAAGSTATDSSAAATMGTGTGSDASGGTGTGDAASGTAGGTSSGGGMATGGSDAASGATMGAGTTGGSTGGTTMPMGSTSGAAGTGTSAGSSSMTGTSAGGTTTDTTTDAGATTSGATTTTAPMTTTTTDSTTVTTTAGDAGATAMSADHPGMLGSWIMNRRIWTTNQPSSTEWANTTLTERPAEWTDIAKVDDLVVDAQGNITGYVADIGGFLGLGAKQVLLNPDALHFVQIGDDAFFATNFTREELEALPDFDTTTVLR